MQLIVVIIMFVLYDTHIRSVPFISRSVTRAPGMGRNPTSVRAWGRISPWEETSITGGISRNKRIVFTSQSEFRIVYAERERPNPQKNFENIENKKEI